MPITREDLQVYIMLFHDLSQNLTYQISFESSLHTDNNSAIPIAYDFHRVEYSTKCVKFNRCFLGVFQLFNSCVWIYKAETCTIVFSAKRALN